MIRIRLHDQSIRFDSIRFVRLFPRLPIYYCTYCDLSLSLSHRWSDGRTIDEIATAALELSQKVRDTDAALVWELAHVISTSANCLEDSLHTGLSLYEGK